MAEPKSTAEGKRTHPLLELTKARLREFYREPGAVFWVFGFPVLMVVALGLAFRDGAPEPPRVAIEKGAPSWIEQALEQEGYTPLQFEGTQGIQQLRSGKVDLLVRSENGGLHFRFDEARPEGQLARALVSDTLQRAQGREDPIPISEQRVTEPGSRYVDYLLPGVIGLNLMGSSMWGIGYNVVVARKRRMLRRFAASPMKRSHFLLSYGFSRMVFLFAELTALLTFGALAFGAQVQGSLLSMILVAMLGTLSFAGLSLLIAARIESLEAANGWLNFIMLPMWLLSGSFFSYQRFPEFLHPAIRLLPLTALNDALRAISSEGASLISTWPELLVLSVWGLACFVLAMRFFRWQ